MHSENVLSSPDSIEQPSRRWAMGDQFVCSYGIGGAFIVADDSLYKGVSLKYCICTSITDLARLAFPYEVGLSSAATHLIGFLQQVSQSPAPTPLQPLHTKRLMFT